MGRISSLVCAALAVAVLALPSVSAADKNHGEKKSKEHDGEVLEVTLIPCNEALCGVTADVVLRKGKVEVSWGGEVEIDLRRGPEDAGLCLDFQPWGTDERVLVGDFNTNEDGNAHAEVGVLDVTAEMGLFIVTDCADRSLLVTGFTTHPRTGGDDDEEVGDGDGEGDDDEVDNPEDPDDDGILDIDDPDDDNDGIPDDEDANPGNPNLFDNVHNPSQLKAAFRKEKGELKNDYRTTLRSLKDQHRSEKKELSDDFRKRKQALR